MSYLANEHRYWELIDAFVDQHMDASAFDAQFSALWRKDRDEEWEIARTWDKRHDIELAEALQRGDICQEEFARKWSELWGYSSPHAWDFVDMLGRIFCACDAFVADPQLRSHPDREYTEEQLRQFVQQTIESYKHSYHGTLTAS